MPVESNAPVAPKTETQTSRSVTVKATTKAESTAIGEGIQLRPWYFATLPGIAKLIQLLFGIICMACASPVLAGYTHFFMFVVATCFLCTVLLCFVYLFSIQDLTTNLPWLFMELIFTAVATLFYVIASIVQLAMSSRRDYAYSLKFFGYFDAYIAAGVFAIFNIIAYGVGLFFHYRDWRQSRQVN